MGTTVIYMGETDSRRGEELVKVERKRRRRRGGGRQEKKRKKEEGLFRRGTRTFVTRLVLSRYVFTRQFSPFARKSGSR